MLCILSLRSLCSYSVAHCKRELLWPKLVTAQIHACEYSYWEVCCVHFSKNKNSFFTMAPDLLGRGFWPGLQYQRWIPSKPIKKHWLLPLLACHYWSKGDFSVWSVWTRAHRVHNWVRVLLKILPLPSPPSSLHSIFGHYKSLLIGRKLPSWFQLDFSMSWNQSMCVLSNRVLP